VVVSTSCPGVIFLIMNKSPKLFLATCGILCSAYSFVPVGYAMTFEQMKDLEGAALLELRVNELLQLCGLPSKITDTGDSSSVKQRVHWQGVEMVLSSMPWEISYTKLLNTASIAQSNWVNPGSASPTCFKNLTTLDIHSKGDVGILTIKKRADNKKYVTSYDIPSDLYVAHKVIGVTGNLAKEVLISQIQERYGNPDETLHSERKTTKYRYWVIVNDNDTPSSLYAVDFIFKEGDKTCAQYTIRGNGFEFVQQKFDLLMQQWVNKYMD